MSLRDAGHFLHSSFCHQIRHFEAPRTKLPLLLRTQLCRNFLSQAKIFVMHPRARPSGSGIQHLVIPTSAFELINLGHMPTQLTAEPDLLDRAIGRTKRRFLPFLLLMYVLSYLDRANIGYAKQAYQAYTGMSDAAFAFGAGVFFLTYALFEIPSNLILHRVGARVDGAHHGHVGFDFRGHSLRQDGNILFARAPAVGRGGSGLLSWVDPVLDLLVPGPRARASHGPVLLWLTARDDPGRAALRPAPGPGRALRFARLAAHVRGGRVDGGGGGSVGTVLSDRPSGNGPRGCQPTNASP